MTECCALYDFLKNIWFIFLEGKSGGGEDGEWECGGGAKGEGELDSQADSLLSTRMLNQLSHPGAPHSMTFLRRLRVVALEFFFTLFLPFLSGAYKLGLWV